MWSVSHSDVTALLFLLLAIVWYSKLEKTLSRVEERLKTIVTLLWEIRNTPNDTDAK